jgi:hypothetical protein
MLLSDIVVAAMSWGAYFGLQNRVERLIQMGRRCRIAGCRDASHPADIAVPPLKRFSCANNGEYQQNGGSNMRGSNLIWTIVGVLAAIALIIWIVSAV